MKLRLRIRSIRVVDPDLALTLREWSALGIDDDDQTGPATSVSEAGNQDEPESPQTA